MQEGGANIFKSRPPLCQMDWHFAQGPPVGLLGAERGPCRAAASKLWPRICWARNQTSKSGWRCCKKFSSKGAAKRCGAPSRNVTFNSRQSRFNSLAMGDKTGCDFIIF